MTVRNLDALFRPASVAVVGASGTPGNPGGIVVRNRHRADESGSLALAPDGGPRGGRKGGRRRR